MNIATIGIDLAKNVFQLHGVNGHGKVVLRRQIHRGQMRGLFVNLAPCPIGMEACASAHYGRNTWVRKAYKNRPFRRFFPAKN